MEPTKTYPTYAEWKAGHEARRAAYRAAAHVWPSWMTEKDIELYKLNQWRPPTGRLISLSGYDQPDAPAGYRYHHESHWSGTNYYTWYYDPIPAVQS